ncbi:hypothetical protein PInf_014137 [Phytophthora infestans]|nr:hypothetical protein PInf_014137 [Phytophthora infestans]
MLQHSYQLYYIDSDFLRLWEARERGVDCKAVSCGAASAAKAEKRKLFQGKFQIKADRVDDWTPAMRAAMLQHSDFQGYGKLVVRRRLQGGQVVGAASAAKAESAQVVGAASAAKAEKRKLFQGKFQIKADRVDDLDSGYADFHGYGEARERGVDCKASGCGAASAAKAEKRKLFQGKFQIKADRVDDWTPAMLRRRLQGGQVVGAASAAKAEKRVSATSVVAAISEAMGSSWCGVDCKASGCGAASAAKAEKRVARRQLSLVISDLLPLIAISYGYGKLVSAASTARRSGCGAASAAKAEKRVARRQLSLVRFPTAMGKLVRRRRLQGGQVVGAASAAKAEKRKLFQGKFQIKADRVDDWTPAMPRECGVDCKASGCGAASAAKAEKRKLFQGKFQIKADRVDDWTPAMRAAMLQHSDFLRLWEARERGVDCKAVRLWAQRRLPRRKTRERDKLFQGKFQIKADRVDDWTPAMPISYGYGKLVSAASTARRSGCGAASAAKAEKRKLFQGKFQIKADRVDDWTPAMRAAMLQHSDFLRLWRSSWVRRRLQGGQVVGAASAAKAEKRGKFQIKADRVDDWTPAMRAAMLQHSYITNSQISDLLPLIAISYGYGKLVRRRRLQGGQVVGAASAAKAEKRVARRQLSLVGKFQIKADRVDDWTPAMRAAMLQHSYITNSQISDLLPLIAISYGYGKLVRRRRLQGGQVVGAASAAKAEKRVARRQLSLVGKFQIKADRVDDWTPAMPRRRLQGGQVVGAASAAKAEKRKLFQGKFQIKADRVDDWTPAMRAAMLQHSDFRRLWEAREAASTARRSGCGAASAAKAEKRKLFQGKFQIKADRVDDWTPAMRAAMLQHSYITNSQISDLLPLIAISYGYGKLVSAASTARRSGCGAASAAKAEKRKLFQGKFQIKADRVDDWTPAMPISYGYGKLVSAASTARRSGCGAASAAKAEKRKLFQGKFQIKADRVDDWTPAMRAAMLQHSDFLRLWEAREAASTARRSGCGAASAAKAEKRVARRQLSLVGKFQIKADRVDDWTPAMRAAMLQHSYITNSQISDLLPLIAISYGYGKLVSAASTARRSGCGAASAAKAEKRKLFQGKFQIKADRVDDWTPAMPRRRLQGGQVVGAASAAKAEKRKLFQGKFQIKADRVDDWTPAMRAAMLQHSYITNSQISDLLPLIAISYGYGKLVRRRRLQGGQVVGAASAAKAEKRKLFQGKFQIKADRVDDWTPAMPRRRLQGGQVVGAASAAKAEKRKLFQGKFQIKADRVDDWTPAMRAAMLQHSYITNSQISDLLPLIAISYGYGKLVSAASTARRSGCGAASAAKAEKRKLFQGKFQIKADRVDDWTPAMPRRRLQGGQVVGAASAAKAEKRFQIKADRVDDLDSGYACSNVTALKLFQGKFQIKADRVDDWTPAMRAAMLQHSYITNSQISDLLPLIAISYGYGKLVSAASTARRSGCGAASAAKAEKRVGATSVVAGSKDRANGLDYSTGLV